MKAVGVPVVSITQSRGSTLSRHSDLVLELGRHSDLVLELGGIDEPGPHGLAPSASTTAMLALGDVESMAVALVDAIEHYVPGWPQRGDAAMAHVRQLTWTRTAKQTLQAYRDATARRCRARCPSWLWRGRRLGASRGGAAREGVSRRRREDRCGGAVSLMSANRGGMTGFRGCGLAG